MKFFRFLGKTMLWLLAIVLAVVLTLPLWIGPVACTVANKVVPNITKTDFHLGRFNLNPYTGRLVVGDLQLANPTNYSEKLAVDLEKLDVNVAMSSLLGKKIRVEYIDLGALKVYSAFDAGNFLQIAKNAQGEGKPADAQSEVKPNEEEPSRDAVAEGEKQGGKGVQIDRLTIHDVMIKYGVIPIPFGFERYGIGAESENGSSLIEIWNEIFAAIMESLSAVGGAVTDLGKGAIDIGGKGLKGLGDAVKSVDIDAGAKAVKDAGKALKNLFK